jgi:mercuric ion binding protein
MRKRFFLTAVLLSLSSLLSPAWGATKTVTLSVPGMTCSVCPITVRAALKKVPGVVKAKVTMNPKEAMVTYDDAKTTVDKLKDATFEAGYPSTVKGAKAK